MSALKEAGVVRGLRSSGFSLPELRKAGYEIRDFKMAGYSAKELRA